MANCKCEESKHSDPRWQIISKKPKGSIFKYEIVYLSCEWEWWSSAEYISKLEWVSQEERKKLNLKSRLP